MALLDRFPALTPAAVWLTFGREATLKHWIALGEIVLANLAWFEELDIEGWLLATILGIAAGAAIWYFVGAVWLLVAASLYLGLLVAVKLAVDRERRKAETRSRARRRA